MWSLSDADASEHYRQYLSVLPKLECNSNPPNILSSHHTLKYLVILLPSLLHSWPPKVQVVTDSSMVNSQSAIQTFLVMVGFYRCHIPRFAQPTFLFCHLLQKNQKFQRTAEGEAEFNDLIAALTGPDIVLRYPDWSKPFHVHTDAMKFSWQPSHGWTLANKNFMLSNGQLNDGNPTFLEHKFIIETDHAYLKWLCSLAPHKAKVARLASLRAQYDLELRHRPGNTNFVSDALSRYPVPQPTLDESSTLSAVFIDLLPPADVCPYLVTAFGLSPYYLALLTSIMSATFELALALASAVTGNSSLTTVELPSKDSTTGEPLTYLGTNRHDFISLLLQDPTLKVLHQYLSAGNKNFALRNLSSWEEIHIHNLARRCLLLEELIMYWDEFLDDWPLSLICP